MAKVYTQVATFPSSSDPTKTHTVSVDEQGNLSCSCPAWVFKKRSGGNRTCWHVEEVERQQARGEVTVSVPTPVQAGEREKGGNLEQIFKRLEVMEKTD